MSTCGERVGPVWKLGGEVCVCILPVGHDDDWHECSCNAKWVDQAAIDAARVDR